jgi:hypothetical protein
MLTENEILNIIERANLVLGEFNQSSLVGQRGEDVPWTRNRDGGVPLPLGAYQLYHSQMSCGCGPD